MLKRRGALAIRRVPLFFALYLYGRPGQAAASGQGNIAPRLVVSPHNRANGFIEVDCAVRSTTGVILPPLAFL